MNWLVGLGVALYALSGYLCFISMWDKGITQKTSDTLANVAFTLYITASVLIAINCIFFYWLD